MILSDHRKLIVIILHFIDFTALQPDKQKSGMQGSISLRTALILDINPDKRFAPFACRL
jgi:hypothetical protein